MGKPELEKFAERIVEAFSALIGFTASICVVIVSAIFALEFPLGLAIVIGATVIAAAIYFKKPYTFNNITVSEADPILREILDLVRKASSTTLDKG